MTAARPLAWHRKISDRRGVAFVEFAIVLPFMMVLYLGGFQLADVISCNRKVTIATRALADLVAQNVSGATSAAEVDGELAAAQIVLRPYQPANAKTRITQVYTDNLFRTTVVWSRGLNTGGYTRGSAFTVPTNLRVPGTYLLYAEMNYAYTPPITYDIVKPMNFGSVLYMLPRNTSSVSCGDC